MHNGLHSLTHQNLGPYPDICLILVKKHVPDDESDIKHLLFIVNIDVGPRQDSLLTIRDQLHVSNSDFPLFSIVYRTMFICAWYAL